MGIDLRDGNQVFIRYDLDVTLETTQEYDLGCCATTCVMYQLEIYILRKNVFN